MSGTSLAVEQKSTGVGLVRTLSTTFPEGLSLKCGATLAPVTVAYETYGELNAAGDNAILLCHALTGDAHAAGWHTPADKVPGWWDPLVGPGRPFDTDRYYVICSNVLGGCAGSTGPASVNPATGRPYGRSFPVITVEDMVRVQHRLLKELGVKRLIAVAGGSLGGLQALEWGRVYPEFVENVISIGAAAALSAQALAWNYTQRQAIYLDPAWQNGDYYGGPGPARGLSLARAIGTITYKSEASWQKKFGHEPASPPEELYRLESRFQVESYLAYQGEKLVRRFDANSYLYLTKAMDLFDLAQGFPSLRAALADYSPRVLMVGISSDFLFPPHQQKEIVRALRAGKKSAVYREIISPYGHDAFLIEFDQLGYIIEEFLLKT